MNKKTEPVNVMKVEFRMQYDECLILSAEDAAALVSILGRAVTINASYGKDTKYTSGMDTDKLILSPYPITELNHLKKAAFLGISITEYKEGLDAANTQSGAGTSQESV